MSAVAAVEARKLVKLYGTVPALIEVDLRVEAGAVCALVGANGAGKTTLLRTLATLARPTSGEATVFGCDVVREADAVRVLVDFLPVRGGVYPELSAAENLRFALRMRGHDPSEREIAAALEWAGLREAGQARARTFSTGMLQRLGLARLRLGRVPLLLLDEPYGAIDEDGRDLVDELLGEARAAGRAAVFATHARERATLLADSELELERGVVVEERKEIVHAIS